MKGNKNNLKKEYLPKQAELTVEFYEAENAQANTSVKKGHKDLNLTPYIKEGLKTVTFKMDK